MNFNLSQFELKSSYFIFSIPKKTIMKIVLVCLFVFLAVYEAQCKCKCDCPKTELVCAMDSSSGEQRSFPSPCALACYNCSFGTKFVVIKKGSC
ncbi:Hypothetical protein NTJ_02484 [Nesidiocoris tenuis]|uniref:Kazal-like domain-containing protein n=1 Tax=Nesidiocoris tenuis TaxID=355587 RepID=A0ABN7AH55_9HEMI|nr:Hypothetical protein NTJ_02484 [Nesidiocoris tenuis]